MARRVDIYVPDAQKATANSRMNTIVGESGQSNTFAISKTIAAATWWIASIILDDAQFGRMKGQFFGLGILWYEGDSALFVNNRSLRYSNSDLAVIGTGNWAISQSEADVNSGAVAFYQEPVYASPSGSTFNNGTEDFPLDLESVVTAYLSTDVVLLDGAYQMQSAYDWDIDSRSIQAETYAGAKVDIQSFAVAITGDSGILDGIVFESSEADRTSSETGSAPGDLTERNIMLDADNSIIRHCTFRNLLVLGFFNAANNSLLYGCHSYYIGWIAPDRGHGHAIYTQNSSGTKTLKRNLFHDCFGWGLHAYSSNGANLVGLVIEENISFRNGSLDLARPDILLGADSVQADGASLIGNRTYGGSGGLNFYGAGASNLTMEDNYCPNGKSGSYTAISETGNNFTTVGNTAFVEADAYDATMAYLAIYNQANANTVNVDVSAIYANGDTVNVMNAQDFENDVQALTVGGGMITVNMQASNRTVESPIGVAAPATSFPTFGAFILRKP